jgi:hypothetical protein
MRTTLRSTDRLDITLPKFAFVSTQACGISDWINLAGDVICWRDLFMTVLSLLDQQQRPFCSENLIDCQIYSYTKCGIVLY